MENRLASLKLNENLNEEHLKDKQQEIEQESVSCFINTYKIVFTYEVTFVHSFKYVLISHYFSLSTYH